MSASNPSKAEQASIRRSWVPLLSRVHLLRLRSRRCGGVGHQVKKEEGKVKAEDGEDKLVERGNKPARAEDSCAPFCPTTAGWDSHVAWIACKY